MARPVSDRLRADTTKGGNTLTSFRYTLDNAGYRTQVADPAGTESYSYDALYRLTGVTYPGPTTDTYTYDAVGNRLTKNSASYTYSNGDRMTAAGGVAYSYDSNGNQTGRGSDTFSWDYENRLTGATVGGTNVTYTYRGDNLRATKRIGTGPTTTYTWDVQAKLPVVLQDGTYSYVYGHSLISQTDGSGVQTYFLGNALGSTEVLTDGSGTVTGTKKYDVFGAVRSTTGSASTEYLYTGQQRDDTLGYTYLRARYYDPAIGRFISKDTHPAKATDPDTINRYAYVGNNPVNVTDPTGEFWDTFLDILSVIIDIKDIIEDVAEMVSSGGESGGDDLGGDFAILGMDVGLALVPGIPAVGAIAKHADDIPFVNGARARAGEIIDKAEAWLGEGYRDINKEVIRSADDQRQFRWNDSCLCGDNPHVHFERVADDGRRLYDERHVYPDYD